MIPPQRDLHFCFGYALFWIRSSFGYVLDTFWIRYGYVLDTDNFGYALDTLWIDFIEFHGFASILQGLPLAISSDFDGFEYPLEFHRISMDLELFCKGCPLGHGTNSPAEVHLAAE